MENNSKTKTKSSSMIKGQDSFINTTPLKFPYKYISVSQVTSYLICPMAYYWKYVERKREKMGSNAIVGIAGHKVFELLSSMEQKEFNTNDLQDIFGMAFTDILMDRDPNDFEKEALEEMDSLKDRLFPSINYYYQNQFKKMNLIGQELQINGNITIKKKEILGSGVAGEMEMGKLTVVGFIDYINNKSGEDLPKIESEVLEEIEDDSIADKLEIGDYKTGSKKDIHYFTNDIQAPLYSKFTNIKNVRIDNITLSNVRYTKSGAPYKNSTFPGYNIVKYKMMEDSIRDMENQISAAAVGIGTGSFPMCHPTSWKCKPAMCAHWEYCRGKYESNDYLKHVTIEKFEDAAMVAANSSTKSTDIMDNLD